VVEKKAPTLLIVVTVLLTAVAEEHLVAVAEVAKGKQGLAEHLAVKAVEVQ
jgi:hypothetical protein